jgi:hypothetical protein
MFRRELTFLLVRKDALIRQRIYSGYIAFTGYLPSNSDYRQHALWIIFTGGILRQYA